jgi:hypothetical protein
MDLARDFDEFIGSLIAHGVDFLIVGAYALAFHRSKSSRSPLSMILAWQTRHLVWRILRGTRSCGVRSRYRGDT